MMTVSGSSHELKKLGLNSSHGLLTKRYFSKDPQNGVLGFRVLGLSGGIFSFFLPETRGKPLPSTLEQALFNISE